MRFANSSIKTGIGLALAAALISGFAIYLNGHAAREFSSPTLFATLKNCFVALVLVLFTFRSSADISELRKLRGTIPLDLLAIAFVGGSVPFLLFFEGLARVESGNAAFLHKTLFLWVAFLAVALLRERLGPIQLAAVSLLLVAHFLIGGPGALKPGDGEAMVLVATLLWAMETIIARRVLREIGSSVGAMVRMAGGALVLLAYLTITGRIGLAFELSAGQWLWVLATGSVLLAYVTAWYGALKRAPAGVVTAVLTVGAPITALLNVVIDGKPLPSADQIAGYSLILAAIAGLAAVSLSEQARCAAASKSSQQSAPARA